MSPKTLLKEKNMNNFFITGVVAQEYETAKIGIKHASEPPRKKVYRNLNKMLEECYLVGSLKYGNNFVG